MDREDIEMIGKVLLIGVVVFVLMLGCISGWSMIFETNYCKTMTSLNSDFEFRWELWGGCLVKTPSGYWIHASEYKYLEGNIQENK